MGEVPPESQDPSAIPEPPHPGVALGVDLEDFVDSLAGWRALEEKQIFGMLVGSIARLLCL
jgi:hypothetical protein